MQTYAVNLNPSLYDAGVRYEVRARSELAAYGQVMRALGRSDKYQNGLTDTRGALWIVAANGYTARVELLHRAPDRNLRPTMY